MANANSKSRPKKRKPVDMTETFAEVLRSEPDLPQPGWPYLPWMRIIDLHCKIFGFEPGERVYLDINHVTRKITISPDYSQLALREQPYYDEDRPDPFA
ncbi:hypothetical protein NUV26_19650 [Burkholderia pseudomultivorans]|uniref:Uncharacterized protein n=1 Tax=Burkholderia pseudomultivorans TaxID=1207504 RepID=A0A6P2RN27_9BURK|nr:hypothetical protein [Burkholderia pseudomultivorans]AOI93739.1 hypothetical protein WS57_13040 [Burkholderia pseudomultivorans]KWI59933.1 hypothetical protein WT72_09015 [Burkholderia pseudomultivorans]MBF5013500.1 hypothetical protein [Burkholderia pseudomultivorans]MDS0794383.1 hypothetical protein [Burkholderia pseudomultivorans]VWC34528.1 hypothetical protein BPS26883_06612 [Burkholderia pseudomultivorans]